MATVRFSNIIERPAEEIFDLLADVSRNPEWCPGFTNAEKITAAPIGRDTAFRTVMSGTGSLDLRITEYERPRRLWFTATTASAEIGHGFVFTPRDDGTDVAQQVDVHPRGLLRLIAPLMALMLKRRIKANTAALKRFLEHAPGGRTVLSMDT